MAGLDDYDRVYRGRPLDIRDPMNPTFDLAGRYQDREVIRPLDIPLIHPLAKDSPQPDDGNSIFVLPSIACFSFFPSILFLFLFPGKVRNEMFKIHAGTT